MNRFTSSFAWMAFLTMAILALFTEVDTHFRNHDSQNTTSSTTHTVVKNVVLDGGHRAP